MVSVNVDNKGIVRDVFVKIFFSYFVYIIKVNGKEGIIRVNSERIKRF